ncbi:hypothetical protein BST61_g1458 [Cercospora zeina]
MNRSDAVEQPDYEGLGGVFAENPFLLSRAGLTVYDLLAALKAFRFVPETNIHRKPLLKCQVNKQAEEKPLLPTSEDQRTVLRINIAPPKEVGMHVGLSQTAKFAGRAISPALVAMAWSRVLKNNPSASWDEKCLVSMPLTLGMQ